MADRSSTDWVVLAEYAAGYEAEIAAGRLDSVGIASRIDRHDAVGIFGPGHSGASVRGVTLYVPHGSFFAARRALDLREDS